ncbi:MAG: DinB family protein [Candidatus Aminicenantes bacterium]|nr:MAG: DinB family protein [Candidatus Aminicenantes bacterium]
MKSSKRNYWLYSSVMMIILVTIMLVGSFELYAGTPGKGGAFGKEVIPLWQRAKDYSVKFAEAMPEEHYKFKPTPEIMSFGEQVVHTGGASFWFASKITGEPNPGKDFKAEGKSKAEIIEYLKKSFDYVEKTLTHLSDEEAAKKIHLFGQLHLTKAQTFMTIRDHTTHHRGQMVIYLRLKGIKPPEYVGW